MRKESFWKIFLQACRISFSRPTLFIYSFLLLFPGLVFFFLPPKKIFTAMENPQFLLNGKYFLFFVFFLSTFITLSVFGKSKLVLLIDSFEKENSKSQKKRSVLTLSNFICALRLAFTFLFLFLLVALLLSMPLIYFWILTTEPSLHLSFLAALTFLPIIFVSFLIGEFSFFYIILSDLKMRSAIENGCRLFLRHTVHTLTFTSLFLAIFLIFTFCFNLAMLGITAVLLGFSPEFSRSFFFIGSFLFAGWVIIVKQVFFLLFFKSIASPEEDPLTPDGEILLEPALRDLPPA